MSPIEYFDVVNQYGYPTGKTVPRAMAHTEGIRHRSAHVWILNQKDGKPYVLLQRRSKHKDSFPDTYDTSSAGHVPAGEVPIRSACRELQEELGIKATPNELSFMGNFEIHTDTMFHDKPFKDNEFDFAYLYTKPVNEIIVQKEELEFAEWFYLLDVLDALQLHHPEYVVPLPSICTFLRYLVEHPSLISENLYQQQVVLAAIHMFLQNNDITKGV